jgi:hypothetical protein
MILLYCISMEKYSQFPNVTEVASVNVEELHNERNTVHEIEHKFEKVTWNEELLTRWLKRFYGLEVSIKEKVDGTFGMKVDTIPDGVPQLPAGYGIKGGGARTMLRSMLQIEAEPPRDIDLVYVGQDEQDMEVSRKLAETHMPDDFDFGYGVERLEEDYFSSRDFTWNEVLYTDGQVVCSKQCLLDTVRNVVRIADYEKQESYRGDPFFVKPKLLAKAVRFVAAARAHGNNKMALSEDTDQAVEMGIDYWHIALHLNRSFEQDQAVAQEYVEELINRGLLPSTIQDGIGALHYLSEETDFIFRAEAADVLDKEIRLAEELSLEKEMLGEDGYEKYGQYSNITPFWNSAK